MIEYKSGRLKDKVSAVSRLDCLGGCSRIAIVARTVSVGRIRRAADGSESDTESYPRRNPTFGSSGYATLTRPTSTSILGQPPRHALSCAH